MAISIQQIICFAIIIISVIGCIKDVMNHANLDEAIKPIISGCSTIITFFLILGYYEEFDLIVTNFLTNIFNDSIRDNGLVHILLLVLVFFLIKACIDSILRLIQSFSLNNAINKLNKNKVFLVTLSTMFGVIRGFVLIILLCIPLVLFNSLIGNSKRIDIFDGFKPYDKLEQLVDSKRVKNISNGIKENASINKIIYYNGITLEEGVKSNDEIDKKAQYIVKKEKSDRDKAKNIYKWVGSNIKYDDDKASKVTNEEGGYKSGAIPTFNTKTGICFDYTCLYTAMAKAVGLKTRIIVGEAYNGDEYVSHAWNEVYLNDEEQWISVDSTFYIAGNYFDSLNFNNDHKIKNVAGEF